MTDTPIRTRTRAVQPPSPQTAPVRVRQRPDATVARQPPPHWPNGAEVRESGTGNLLGWTVRNKDGSYDVWSCEPVFRGTTKTFDFDAQMKIMRGSKKST